MTYLRWMPAAALAPLALIAAVRAALVLGTRGRRYDRVADVPAAPVALVLGAKVYPDGRPSRLLARRLDLALDLYRHGTVQAILVSGDHGRKGYDEVAVMTDYLRTHGIPATRIAADHAGFDTWASATRAARIFGVDRAIVVTQHFHLPRAVALGRRAGIDTYGLGDDSSAEHPNVTRQQQIRELFAGLKAAWTLLVRPDPEHLGAPEPGVTDALAAARRSQEPPGAP